MKNHSLVFLKASGTSEVLITGICRPGCGGMDETSSQAGGPSARSGWGEGVGMWGAGQPQLMGPSTVESVQ